MRLGEGSIVQKASTELSILSRVSQYGRSNNTVRYHTCDLFKLWSFFSVNISSLPFIIPTSLYYIPSIIFVIIMYLVLVGLFLGVIFGTFHLRFPHHPFALLFGGIRTLAAYLLLPLPPIMRCFVLASFMMTTVTATIIAANAGALPLPPPQRLTQRRI